MAMATVVVVVVVVVVVWMSDERNRKVLTRVGSATVDLAAVSARERRVQDLAESSRRAVGPAIRMLTSRP